MIANARMNSIFLKRMDYGADVLRVQQAVIRNGFVCSLEQAEALWLAYSDSLCAGWLDMASWSDTGIYDAVKQWIDDAGQLNG